MALNIPTDVAQFYVFSLKLAQELSIYDLMIFGHHEMSYEEAKNNTIISLSRVMCLGKTEPFSFWWCYSR